MLRSARVSMKNLKLAKSVLDHHWGFFLLEAVEEIGSCTAHCVLGPLQNSTALRGTCCLS